MPAKNTTSILETIRKKMQKFDNKGIEANAAAVSSGGEFDSLASQNAPKNPTPAAPQAPEVKFEDDLGLEDLDNENGFEQKASTAQAPNEQEEIFNENEIEEFENQEDEFEIEAAKDNRPQSQEEHHDDLEDELENLDLNDLEHEEVAQDQRPKEDNASQDLSDEELDKLLLEDEEHLDAAPAKEKLDAEPLVANNEEDEDFDFDNFEEEKSAPVMQKVAEVRNPPVLQRSEAASMKMPKVDAIHDIIKDEVDLEFEKEFMGFEPKKNKAEVQQMELPPMGLKENFTRANVINNPAANMPQAMSRQMTSNPVMNYSSQPASIINEETMIKTTESVKKLIDAKNMVNSVSNFSQSPVLAEIALQLLEPKLEKWFHENLPQMVEKIVSEEIKKIIPKS